VAGSFFFLPKFFGRGGLTIGAWTARRAKRHSAAAFCSSTFQDNHI
jgi:hypothetical protein